MDGMFAKGFEIFKRGVILEMAKIKVNHAYPFTNDYMFATVMKEPAFCKELLNRIMPDKKVKKIKLIDRDETYQAGQTANVHTQSTLGYDPYSKSVRLDVTFEDDDAAYNIEMQVNHSIELPKRSRYYSSQLDLELMPKGGSYPDLKASYIIFICMFDYFKTGKVFHFFETYDVKNELRLNDGRFTIIVNTKGKEPGMSEKLCNLFDYINSNVMESTDEFLSIIDNEISWFNREDGEWRRSIMRLDEKMQLEARMAKEEGLREGIDLGKREGRQESLLETARKMKLEDIPYETIAKITGFTVEKIAELD